MPDYTCGAQFEEGADARARGKVLADNPYCIQTAEHAEWAAGWNALFDLDEDDDPASNRVHPSDVELPNA